MWPFFTRAVLAVILATAVAPVASGADIVLQWNIYARETMKRDSANSNPGWGTRSLAMMNGAIYDCFQAIHRTHEPFLSDRTAAASTSRAAAATEAAYRVLREAYAGEASWLLWAQSYQLSLIPEGPAKAEGVALGAAVAGDWLTWRHDDGATSSVPYEPTLLPGKWRPDPLNPTQVAWGPEWGAVATFALEHSMQFPVPPPPAMDSAEYVTAFEEVRDMGARTSAVRTADQTLVGLFWAYDRSGLGPPPVLYSRVLHEVATQRGNTEAQNARLFAMASVAMADAATAAWDAKFTDNFWRPITAIREADTDGNAATSPLPGWEPLGCPGGGIVPDFTPSFPAYPSGHATIGESLFTTLKAFYGADEMAFTLTSEELPGHVRHYTSLSQAAHENADSRVWLGVHWRFDQTAGRELGEKVATHVTTTRFAPVAAPPEDMAWTLAGPAAGSGYTTVAKTGNYTVNGHFDVRVASDFLLQLTPQHTFTLLTATGTLDGLPTNATSGRLPTGDGYGSFRLALTGQALVLDDFQLTPGLVETFASFAAAHALSGNPDDDADDDGVSDFAEWAFSTDPQARDRPPAATVETLNGQRCLVLRYHRRSGRVLAGLFLEAQRSEDLADWNTGGLTDEIDPDATPVAGAEPRRAWFPLPAEGTAFLRLWGRQE